MDDRLVTAARVDEDAQYEAGLRPRLLDEYIGHSGASRWTTSCCTDRRASARRRWRT